MLEEVGISVDVFLDMVLEFMVRFIYCGVDVFKIYVYDSIIVLGGGSFIDSVKVIVILGKYGGEMWDYKFLWVVDEVGLLIIVIFIIVGMGLEVMWFIIIIDEDIIEKMLCVGLGFMLMVVLVDYLLM